MEKFVKFCLVYLVAMTFAGGLFAGSATISNKDSKSYQILLNSSESCFSGTHSSIGSNTTTSVSEGWACLNKKKPAFKLESGKSYIIKNGKIQKK